MKGMQEVPEIFQAPPPGTYPIVIIAANPSISGKGNSQIEVDLEIADGKFKGEQFRDWVGTDPGAKGAGIGRGKLRVLLQNTQFAGLADAPSNNEVPDSAIAQVLVGQRLFVVCDNSPRKRKNEDGTRSTENMTQLDPATGNLITIMNVDVKGYTRHFAGQAQTATQTQTQSIPQGQPAFVQQAQALPQQQTQILPQQQIQPQYTQSTQGQGLPQGGPAFTPNFQAQGATPPWQQGAPSNGVSPSATEQPVARKRKVVVTDAQ